jgi:hypothetical protein
MALRVGPVESTTNQRAEALPLSNSILDIGR